VRTVNQQLASPSLVLQQGDVLYLALEDSKLRLQKRLRALGGVVPAALKMTVNAPTLNNGLLNLLDDWITNADRPQLVVIDTLGKIRDNATMSKGNVFQGDYEYIGEMKRLADRHHIALVVIHHPNKEKKGVSDPFERINGSNALMSAADSAMIFHRERGSKDARITFTGRDVCGEDILLRMESEGKWTAINEEALARERYEIDKVVQLCRALMQESFGKQIEMTTQAFLDAGVQRYNEQLASSTTAMTQHLNKIAPMLSEYDGIVIDMGKKVGSGRGFRMRKVGV
jgi:RecA-family ATPase